MLRLGVYADKHHQSFAPSNIIHHVEMRPVPHHVKHKVYFDNYFTSPKLQVTLAKAGILSLGAVRENRLRGCQLKSEKELKKKGRGSSEELMGEVDGIELSCVRWFDNRAVTLLSTFTGQSPVQKAKRSSSDKKEFTDIDFPNVVQKSNHHMG
ncbi:hypothetical protein HPB47_016780, partial [Ixodes persulcatus]